MPRLTIAIIGGGFSGASLATHLAKRGLRDAVVYVIEERSEIGRGTAYSTEEPSHLLNVRAKGMSAFQSDSNHFVQWLDARYPGKFGPDDFVPRTLFGEYSHELFQSAVENGSPSIRQANGIAIGLERAADRARITLASGRVIDADIVVLATGHFPPGHPAGVPSALYGHPAYIADPWSSDALSGIEQNSRVLMVGTGLTAIDLTLSVLERVKGAKITLISPTGEFPQIHTQIVPHRLSEDPLPTNLRQLVKRIRNEISRAGDWRSVMDALRPHTINLWLGLTVEDRKKFLSHVRPLFERYRHRMSADTARRLAELREQGSITVVKGTLKHLEPKDSRLSCTLAQAGEEQTETFDRIINCTGPLCDYRRMQHPLIRSLLDSGRIRPDPLHLGMDATPEGSLLDNQGTPSDWLFTLGPTLKGTLWETTAVPEIRVQAEALAKRIDEMCS